MTQWMPPKKIIWQNWDKDATVVLPIYRWELFDVLESKGCLYAGYENCVEGEDFGSFLYLRFSKKDGSVTGAKMTPDDIDSVAGAWNDYDTPRAACRGWCFRKYTSKIHAEMVTA